MPALTPTDDYDWTLFIPGLRKAIENKEKTVPEKSKPLVLKLEPSKPVLKKD